MCGSADLLRDVSGRIGSLAFPATFRPSRQRVGRDSRLRQCCRDASDGGDMEGIVGIRASHHPETRRHSGPLAWEGCFVPGRGGHVCAWRGLVAGKLARRGPHDPGLLQSCLHDSRVLPLKPSRQPCTRGHSRPLIFVAHVSMMRSLSTEAPAMGR